jgi:hypothetical protein
LTEIDVEHVGLFQSLIATCRWHGIDPYSYLTDVPLRMSIHPARNVADLTTRLWKKKFADNPLLLGLWMANNASPNDRLPICALVEIKNISLPSA